MIWNFLAFQHIIASHFNPALTHRSKEGEMRVHEYPAWLQSRILVGLAILGGIVGLVTAESYGVNSDYTRATLRGRSVIDVVIEVLYPDFERAGLSKQQLQTDVELRLRQAGIRICTKEELERVPGRPWLYVIVNGVVGGDRRATYSILVELNQDARLNADDSSAIVTTWKTGLIGTGQIDDIPTHIRNGLRDKVDDFINAYLSVNPRPAGIPAPASISSASPRRDVIRQVQQRLQAVGYNPGTVDGAMGPQTRDALRWFQNTKGLRPTGEPDEATLDALGVR
jgi:hypothetical protein